MPPYVRIGPIEMAVLAGLSAAEEHPGALLLESDTDDLAAFLLLENGDYLQLEG